MGTKSFLSLLVGVLVFGGAVGGAFIGGIQIGEGRAAAATSLPSGPVTFPDGAQFPPGDGAAFTFGPNGTSGGFAGSAGGTVAGAVTSVDGDALTLDTPQGPLTVKVGAGTAVRRTVTEGPSSLALGEQVVILGQRGENGILEAAAINVVTEGDAFVGGFRRPRTTEGLPSAQP